MTKQHFILQTILAIVFSSSLTAQIGIQTIRQLPLDEAISSALSNNKTVQLAKMNEAMAGANYKQTEAIYLPQIGLSYTGFSTNNPLNAFGFKLQQKNISQNDFIPDLLNHPSTTTDFTTKLEVQQPLINMDAVYVRKSAAKQIEVYQYKTQRTRDYISFEVQKNYLQLQLYYESVAVLEDALATTKALYLFTNNHFKQGLIQKSDVLNVQVTVATLENNLAKAKSNISNTSDYLSRLMGVPIGTIYTVTKPNITIINSNDSITNSRADFMAMQKAIDASSLMIQSSKMSYLPKLNAFGSYQLNDSRMLGFGAGAYLGGIQLSWNIFQGNKTKNTILTQTIARDQLSTQLEQQKEESNADLSKTKRDISDAQSEIVKQQMAIEQATEALRILQNRYEQGLVNTTDVMMATTQLSEQKFGLSQAIFNQNLSKAYLQLLTSSVTK